MQAIRHKSLRIWIIIITNFNFLLGLQLGVAHDKVYSGIWGYNNVLTGSALGGNLFVLNGQTAAAAVMGIIFTSLVQYSLESILIKVIKAFHFFDDL